MQTDVGIHIYISETVRFFRVESVLRIRLKPARQIHAIRPYVFLYSCIYLFDPSKFVPDRKSVTLSKHFIPPVFLFPSLYLRVCVCVTRVRVQERRCWWFTSPKRPDFTATLTIPHIVYIELTFITATLLLCCAFIYAKKNNKKIKKYK